MRTISDNTRHKGGQAFRSGSIPLHRFLPAGPRLCGALIILAAVLSLATSAIAQGAGVRIENISPPRVEAEPGQIVSATFRIRNETDRQREFNASATLPATWSLVTPLFPFALKPAEEKFLFLAISLPRYELAGNYLVRVQVADTSFAGVTDEATVEVEVIAVAKVEVRPPAGEYRVLAGDTYTRTFTVLNQSNAPSRFEVDVASLHAWEAVAEPTEFSLEAGASQPVVVTVETPEEVDREEHHRLTLKARSLDLNHGTVEAEAGVTTIVYPRLLIGDMYETLRGDYSLLFSWEDAGDVAGQFELDLKGELDEGRWGEVYFRGPYPSKWHGQWLLQEDRFHIEYGDEKKGYLSLGDDTLEVTPLTERYFYGRGIDLEVRRDPMAFRVFASKRQSGWIPEQLLGAQVSVQAPGNTEFALTAMRKQETSVPSYLARGNQKGSMVSLSATSNPAEGVELEGEYGWGNFDDGEGGGSDSDSAYRLSGQVNRDWFDFSGELVRAGAHFPGYWQDAKLSQAYLSVHPLRNVSVWGSFSDSEYNIEGDPLRARPRFSQRSAGVSFPAGPFGRASVFQRRYQREDVNLAGWNDRDRTTNFQLSRSFGDISLTGTAEFGKRRDLLTGTERDLNRYRLMFSARPSSDATINGGYSWDVEDAALGATREKRNQLWLNADLRLGERTEVAATYSRSDGSGRPGYNWLRADLKHELKGGRSIQIRIQRRGGALGSELAAAVEFTFPLSVPVRWLPKTGRLEGRVYLNQGREEPLSDVLVYVDGLKVATDEKGHFVFPSLASGEYELRIDRGTLGLEQIPEAPAPFIFSVKAGETVKLGIPIVAGATVNGSVLTPQWLNGNGNHNGNHIVNGAQDADSTDEGGSDGNGDTASSVPLKSLGSGNGNHNGHPNGNRGANGAGSVSLDSLGKSKGNGNGNGNGHLNGNGNGAGGDYTLVGVSGVLVVLENGTERFARMTDLDGEFSFGELRPGRWKLTLAEGQVPKHYELAPPELELTVVPGQFAEGIEFIISPVARPVIVTTTEKENRS